MKVFVLNSGSSSIKFQLFDCVGAPAALAKGVVERIGLAGSRLTCACSRAPHNPSCPAKRVAADVPDHATGIKLVCNCLLNKACGLLDRLDEVAGIGHRVVHGGESFTESVRITEVVIDAIENCVKLAPLHNRPALMGIRAGTEVFPNVPQVAVFDTAFHQTLPRHRYLYAAPLEFYEEYGVRKYGFHGISHQYVARKAARLLGTGPERLKAITCHLGNGSSITAVDSGKSVDTSMGFTPLSGVMMGSRSGDLDPYIPLFLHTEAGIELNRIPEVLNKESGLKGVCRLRDVRDVLAGAERGDKQCRLALDMFVYRLAAYIGAYWVILGGPDAIVFTAGIGENVPEVRRRVLEKFRFLGVTVDEAKNAENAVDISGKNTSVRVLVIPTNEELVIAQETARIVDALDAAGAATRRDQSALPRPP
ncbi:MAG TPA: acetate kinase [Candidatus Hydrogenedentes bacterium]|nr:acetate kinase [Candidatus Hydrogenedentota bacterium]